MFHKATELKLKKGTSLEVSFQSGEVKAYDMAVLFEKYPQLEALKDRKLFLKGKLIGSYGIIWNENLDIEVETIYEDGDTVRIIPEVNMTVANAVYRARARAALSQADLSEKSGIDQSDISKIERGVSNPSVSTLNRLAKAMDMKMEIEFV